LFLQFGKGIYFADMSSKSANYCYATRTKNVGLVLLSEVSVLSISCTMMCCLRADKDHTDMLTVLM